MVGGGPTTSAPRPAGNGPDLHHQAVDCNQGPSGSSCPKGRSDVSATRTIEKARQALDRGKGRQALRLGWRAASQALREANAGAVLAVRHLADDASASEDDRVRRDSEHLSAYCRALLDGAGGGMHPTHPLDALFMRPPAPTARTPCPMCAEDIVAGARVCKHCGHTFDAT